MAAATQNQALAAILFLYKEVLGCDPGWLDELVRAERPRRLPVVLSRAEVQALLGKLDGLSWIMATLLYGSGLRLSECLRLRVKDIDFTRNEIVVREGKGDKDRVLNRGGHGVESPADRLSDAEGGRRSQARAASYDVMKLRRRVVQPLKWTTEYDRNCCFTNRATHATVAWVGGLISGVEM